MDDCDLWEGYRYPKGYGRLYIAKVDSRDMNMFTHRLVWMQDNGHTDLCILHSCDTPSCINIEHLRAGTYQENVDDREERGRNYNSLKTHCSQGHEFTPENTYNAPPNNHRNGRRKCRTCHRIRILARYHRMKETTTNRREQWIK